VLLACEEEEELILSQSLSDAKSLSQHEWNAALVTLKFATLGVQKPFRSVN